MGAGTKKNRGSTKTQSEKTKTELKLKDLKPKQNPKGGRAGPAEGIWSNHNETLVCDNSC